MADISTEFYWDNIVFKVENTLFRVPRYEFEQSSEVFADMFLLPSGAAENTEGQDKEHPIVLEGYRKDEFSCLLRVMFPRTKSLISGTKLELSLKKEEWVNVLKLTTVWNMNYIREYAIHRLSIEGVLTAIEKIQLARAYRVANWMEEGVINLINGGHRLTRADLTTLGWETSALILWMKDTMSFLNSSPLRFTPDMIQCGKCSSNLTSVLYSECVSCDEPIDMGELEHTAPVTSLAPGTIDPLVKLECICCTQCEHRFYTKNVRCPSCSSLARDCGIRITLKKRLDEKIDEVFGEEIRDHF